MEVKVLRAGPLASVQDAGRFGYQALGMPPSGVMDMLAYRDACLLTGNIGGEAVLEITVFGAAFELGGDVVFAITGADMQPELSGTPIPMNQAVLGRQGDTLSLGMAIDGCRAYLSFAGGIAVPPVMGSRSTNLKCGIGGFCGRALQDGDVLPIGDCGETAPERFARCQDMRVFEREFPHRLVIDVIPGPQEERFTEAGLHTFYSGTYVVSGQSDRMGYRLDGPEVESLGGTDIISDGTVMGSVQIPQDGRPIILMADRQTTGGYAKIATVHSADLPKLAQALPGTEVQFRQCRMNLNSARR